MGGGEAFGGGGSIYCGAVVGDLRDKVKRVELTELRKAIAR
jgi:hypothetical protein